MSDDILARIDDTLLNGAELEWDAVSGPTETGRSGLSEVLMAGTVSMAEALEAVDQLRPPAAAAVRRGVAAAREFEAANERVNELLSRARREAFESGGETTPTYVDRTGPDGITRSWARCYAVPVFTEEPADRDLDDRTWIATRIARLFRTSPKETDRP